MSLPAPGHTHYRPRAATNDLEEIIEDHSEELFRLYDERFLSLYGPLHPRVKELMHSFLRCGDPHFGFLRLRCPECGENKLVPFS